MLRSRALLAGQQASLGIEGHAVRHVRVLADGRDAVGLEWEAVAVQGDPLHLNLRVARARHLAGAREGREVEGVLAGNVDGPLVGIGGKHSSQSRRRPEDSSEDRVVGDEWGAFGMGAEAPDGTRLAHPIQSGQARIRYGYSG